jgi:hypothetical protein
VYVDQASFPQAPLTTPEVFAVIAGRNGEGDIPSGLDRELDTSAQIYFDDSKKDEESGKGLVVGIDIIPDRTYLRNTHPLEMDKVTTVEIEFEANGAVWRVTKRPPKMRLAAVATLVTQLRAIAAKQAAGKKGDAEAAEIHNGQRLPKDLGKLELLTPSTMTITPRLIKSVLGRPEDEIETFQQEIQ